MPELFKLPYRRVSPQDKHSFAYSTLVKRWPTILTGVISTISNILHELHGDDSVPAKEKLQEGKEIVGRISGMKHEMGRNVPLPFIEDDGEGNVECYNEELEGIPGGERGWSEMDWLFAECYVYRRLRTFFALTKHWKTFDPFFQSKADTYRSSSGAIIHLAQALNAMVDREDLQNGWESPGSPLEIAFMEMIQADLWGNATDLSLLVDLKYEDLQKLQAVGAKAQAEQAKLILRNDLGRVWGYLKGVKEGRLDIVMDNAGFELYTDFIFADFMVSCTPFVKEVVFHGKAIPWFVSDVVPYDFVWAIDSLLDKDFFSTTATPPEPEETASLALLANRWKSHLSSGVWKLSVPTSTALGQAQTDSLGGFWTTQYAFQDLPAVAPQVLHELQKSDLVVFKGDLNYRKLIGDAWWPTTTPFDEALGPLAGKISLLSLRTNKADTIAGLDAGIEERMDKEDPQWRVSGKYAVVSFSPTR